MAKTERIVIPGLNLDLGTIEWAVEGGSVRIRAVPATDNTHELGGAGIPPRPFISPATRDGTRGDVCCCAGGCSAGRRPSNLLPDGCSVNVGGKAAVV